jgi:IS30 family transposase
LKHNISKKGYSSKQAYRLAYSRHKEKNKCIKLSTEVKDNTINKLKLYHSPEQTLSCLDLDENIKMSTVTSYRFVIKDKEVGGELYKHLRHQHKKYRKRYGKNDYRGKIPNRIDICDRPAIVDTRTRIGDWELNLIINKGHKDNFATPAERKSTLYLPIPLKIKHQPLPIRQYSSY